MFNDKTVKSIQPYGMYFAEEVSTAKSLSDFAPQYDETAGYTVITQDGHTTPLVKAAMSCTMTQTVTEREEKPEDSPGEGTSDFQTSLLTQTATKAKPEGPDDDQEAIYGLLATVTVTKSGEAPQDDDSPSIEEIW